MLSIKIVFTKPDKHTKEEHLGLREMKWWENGENYTTKSSTICTPHLILRSLNQEGWGEQGM